VSPTYHSWVQATELRQIAEIVDRPEGAGITGDVDLARLEAPARALADAEAAGRRNRQIDELRRAFAEYQRDLALIGLSDGQVSDRGHPGRRRLVVLWSATRVLAALPAAVVGTVIHLVPYQIMKRVGTVPTNESIRATVKLLGCFVLFTLVYVVLGVVVAGTWGPWAGLAAAAGAPACGYAAVRLRRRAAGRTGEADRWCGGRGAGAAKAAGGAGDGAGPPVCRGRRRQGRPGPGLRSGRRSRRRSPVAPLG
jgi:hypothetical protein